MTHIYKVTGMTCETCESTVKKSLLLLPNVSEVEVSKEKQLAIITMDKHISLSTFQNALSPNYNITTIEHNKTAEQFKNWLSTYKPILIILAYITTISIIAGTQYNNFQWIKSMNIFMAGFFLTFSFFKMLDLKGFTESYNRYDIVAKKIKAWGYVYAFIELSLGIAYTANFQPFVTNIVTLFVMTISIIGVLQSVLNKRKIQCACLGVVFKLPMSTITIIEDALMIAMSGIMLLSIN